MYEIINITSINTAYIKLPVKIFGFWMSLILTKAAFIWS